ncbi:DUF177 domain-containing protein [Spongiibacter sp. KMU-158]|uniref:Large ribosomal RNA subunit accumulation protein YceD n=1 Tax=Spongiibacter pelagi TaxID=2760804 RepID=A0A927C1P9_9GAMM|nr:YceD family protein [Spongiibacter pelagi]MBD2859663.1 DUF177 domain-containing protein [Spongiibacter pelagi]
MQRQPLPKMVEARKFATAGCEVSAAVPVSALPRFVEGLATDSGVVDVDLQFFRDEQGFFRVAGKAVSNVEVFCQRCLEAMPVDLQADFELAIVWNDEQAKALPKSLDPVILGDEPLNLYDLVQDELILNTPFVNYHPEADCSVKLAEFNPEVEQQEGTESQEGGESPFSVLGQLFPKK